MKSDICICQSVFSGAEVIKLFLAGSTYVQVLSPLNKNSVPQSVKINKELTTGWIAKTIKL
jgi:hypothetical protein